MSGFTENRRLTFRFRDSTLRPLHNLKGFKALPIRYTQKGPPPGSPVLGTTPQTLKGRFKKFTKKATPSFQPIPWGARPRVFSSINSAQ